MTTRSNLTLEIEADSAAGVKAVDDLVKAEGRLEVATKKGASAAKERLAVDDKLTTAIEERTTAEERAGRAGRETAKAEAQLTEAQRKRLAQERAIARERQSIKVESMGTVAAARAQIREDAELHRQTMKQRREAQAAAEKLSDVEKTVGLSALKMVGGFVGLGSVAAAAKLVTDEILRMNQALVDSAKAANTQSLGLREFVAQQEPGKEGTEFVGEVLIAGAQRGLSPGQSAAVAGPIQSVADADGDGKLSGEERANFNTDFGAAAGMAEAGVESEDALKIITAGRARGQSGAYSADLMAKAAQLSAVNPKDVAKSISSTSEFSDQKEALSIYNALAVEQTDTGKHPAAMERLGIILGKSGEVGDTKAFSKKYGLEGLSETDKVERLYRTALVKGKGRTAEERVRNFTALLPGEKGLGVETAMDLGRVIRQRDTMQKAEGALGESSEGALDEILKKGEESPFTAGGVLQARQKALREVGELIGPQAEAAQAALAKRQVAGAEAIASGDVANIADTGELKSIEDQTWASRFRTGAESVEVSYGMHPASANMAAQSPSEISRRTSEAEAKRARDGRTVDDAQRELVEALKENNRLVAENNEAMKSGAGGQVAKPAVGGAKSNAEERY